MVSLGVGWTGCRSLQRAESGCQVEFVSPGLIAADWYLHVDKASNVSNFISKRGFSLSTLVSTLWLCLIFTLSFSLV